MILDVLSYHTQYLPLHPSFARAFDFILKDSQPLAAGRYELGEGSLYAMVQEYETKAVDEWVFEAHRKYIDIQAVISGAETIYYAALPGLQALAYQEEKDYLPLAGKGQALALHAGEFCIFFPQDAHLPGRTLETPASVRKVVVKVPLLR